MFKYYPLESYGILLCAISNYNVSLFSYKNLLVAPLE